MTPQDVDSYNNTKDTNKIPLIDRRIIFKINFCNSNKLGILLLKILKIQRLKNDV